MLRLLRWWRSRAAPPPSSPPFDAVIDLGVGEMPFGAGDAAVACVRDQLARQPGARRLHVRAKGDTARTVMRLYAPGRSIEPDGAAWSALRTRLLAIVDDALAETRHSLSMGGDGAATGFAEAMDPRIAAELEALTALASSMAANRAAPAPLPLPRDAAPADVDRLAHLLGFVLPEKDTMAARRAVQRFGSYAGVLAAPTPELLQVRGFGPHAVAAVRLVHEAAIRLSRAGLVQQPVLHERARLFEYLSAVLAREPIEQFRVLFLDQRGLLLADEVQARGTVNHTPVYPREVVRRAIELNAAALVLVHNHPSGDPTPSREDLAMTRQVGLAAAALSLDLHDHIIVGNGRRLSFRDEGLLPT